jgi:hypothetical protein
VPNEYVIVALPGVALHRVPVAASIVATATLLLLHIPPGTALLSVTTLPTHKPVGPEMATGAGTTVNVVIALGQLPTV